MTAFPLLHIPSECLGTVLDHFTLMELFDLTQCSQKMLTKIKNSVPSAKRRFDVCVMIQSSPQVQLSVQTDTGFYYPLDYSLNWEFFGKRDVGHLDFKNPEIYQISGRDVEVSRNWRRTTFFCRTPVTLAKVLEFAEQFLCDVFNVKVRSVEIQVDVGVLDTLCSSLFYRSLRSVTIYESETCFFNYNAQRERRMRDLSHAELRQILDDFEEFDHLHIHCDAGDDFVFEKPLIAKWLWISEGGWLTRSNLMSFDRCERVHLEDSVLKEEDLNAFLHQWMNGHNSQFDNLEVQIRQSRFQKSLNMAEILEGLPVFPGWPKRENARRRNRVGVIYHEGYDLRRESDGMLGTVVTFGEHEIKDTLIFVAWQDPNPNVAFDMIDL